MFSQQIEILPVTDVDQHAFLGALNAAYADYFIPIRMAPASLAELIRRESIDLSVSAAATYQGQVIGMGMLAHREQRGWIGGMGVIPTFRRQGVGRQIMHYLMDRARDLNLATVQLEVITQNTPAYNLYLSLGFTTLRELHVMTKDGSISRAPSRENIPPGIFVEARSIDTLLDALLHITNGAEPWQREWSVLQGLATHLRGLATFQTAGEQIEAVCLYIPRSDHIDLFEIAASNPIAAEALLLELFTQHKNAFYSYLNIAENDPVLPLMQEYGFEIHISQYEMLYTFAVEN